MEATVDWNEATLLVTQKIRQKRCNSLRLMDIIDLIFKTWELVCAFRVKRRTTGDT